MTTSRLVKLRVRAAQRQEWCCFYCGGPMLDTAKTDERGRRHRHLRCTAEHLTPRSEGGADSAANIVAACWYCNSRRHMRKRAPTPEAYRQLVRARVGKGKWLR